MRVLYLAVRYDVQARVEVDLIACSCPAVYYFLGHGAKGVVSLRSFDDVVSSFILGSSVNKVVSAPAGACGRPLLVTGATKPLRHRYLALILDALHASHGTQLPGPPPSWEEIAQRWET